MIRLRLSRPRRGCTFTARCFVTASTTGLVAMLMGEPATTPESRAFETHNEESGIQTSGRSPELVRAFATSVAGATLKTLMAHGVTRHALELMAAVAARRTTLAISGAAATART